MITDESYPMFKQAFLDQVTLKGYDGDFIEGFFKRAEEEYSYWETLVQNAYHGDPNLCKQACVELAFCLQQYYDVNEKRAAGPPAMSLSSDPAATPASAPPAGDPAMPWGPTVLGLLNRLGSAAGGLFHQQGGSGLGGAIAGGGGGLMIGMLLSHLLGVPLHVGMLLGTLAGGAMGYGAAGTEQGKKSIFGVNGPGANELPAETALAAKTPHADVPAEPPAAAPMPAPGASPIAAGHVAAAQAASNQVGAAHAGTAPMPAAPVQPPPGAASVAPPQPAPGVSPGPGALPPQGTSPVTPPGARQGRPKLGR